MFGLCLLNDWSARDVQAWEYQPLGPFLAKNFATTVSPWIVTLEALAPFRGRWRRPAGGAAATRLPRRCGRPCRGSHRHASSRCGSRAHACAPPACRRSASRTANFRDSWWTVAQMVAHHTVNGCNLDAGRSPRQRHAVGSAAGAGRLAPRADRAAASGPSRSPSGEQRTFLEDGDRVSFRAWCERAGLRRIGFGVGAAPADGTALYAVA